MSLSSKEVVNVDWTCEKCPMYLEFQDDTEMVSICNDQMYFDFDTKRYIKLTDDNYEEMCKLAMQGKGKTGCGCDISYMRMNNESCPLGKWKQANISTQET